jgi:putative PIN family toxin of toxin-antitoxin system
MRIVLDTNVLISGLIHADGAPGRIVDLLRSGVLQPVVDDRILAEYANVLRRPFLRTYISAWECEHIMEYLRHNSWYVTATLVVHDMPYPGDIPFLEIALGEQAPLITGNRRHFPAISARACEIYSPADFLRRYAIGVA